MEEQKGFFESIGGRNGFFLGLGTGVFGLLSVGFVILAVMVLTGKTPSEAKYPAPTPSQGADQIAPSAKAEFDIKKTDHIIGNPKADVTLVEFSDFQCPFCSRFFPTVQEILKNYGNKVRIVYKHFPLDSLHPEARPAAIASECAYEQKGNDGFFKFHDEFFTNQDKLSKQYYLDTAKKFGLNVSKFESCLSDADIAAKVQADYQEGLAKGVQGTPATFVNGELLSGALPYDNFKSIIETELAR